MIRFAGATARALSFAIAMLALPSAASADMEQPFANRLTQVVLTAIFDDPVQVMDMTEDPPMATIGRDGELIGYAFSTHETVSPKGYSGESFDIIVGMDLDGRVVGTALLEEHEPMIGPSLIPQQKLEEYFEGLIGAEVSRGIYKQRGRGVDGVAGATISATLMHGAILLASRRIARAEGLIGDDDGAVLALDLDSYSPKTWAEMIEEGTVGHYVEGEDGGESVDLAGRRPFIDLYVALATPAAIGRNIFGDQWYGHHLSQLGVGEQLLVIAGRGRYTWKAGGPGTAPVLGAAGREFERIRLVQGEREFRLGVGDALSHTAIRADGVPRIHELGLFRIAADSDFDPLMPWRFELLVAADPADQAPRTVTIPYRLPVSLVLGSDADLEAAGLKEPTYLMFGLVRESALADWQLAWLDQALSIAILLILFIVLSGIFIFQNQLTRRRRLHTLVRVAFLAVVLVWLGWIAGAQLTIVNVLTYFQVAFAGLDWRFLLLEPLIVLIIVYTLLSLVLLGRGVFCGWLCPFGALQELLYKFGRLLRLPAWTPPFAVNEQLWALKYVIVIGLIAAAVYSMSLATTLAEVEPFKTAITLKFARSWPYVAYAVALLAIGLFVERFYCRFLCPLGGALALLGRWRMFSWLQRRAQCGNPCHICEVSCPVQAIAPDGKINLNECFQCLDCQVDYYDDHTCPPLVSRRRRLVRAGG